MAATAVMSAMLVQCLAQKAWHPEWLRRSTELCDSVWKHYREGGTLLLRENFNPAVNFKADYLAESQKGRAHAAVPAPKGFSRKTKTENCALGCTTCGLTQLCCGDFWNTQNCARAAATWKFAATRSRNCGEKTGTTRFFAHKRGDRLQFCIFRRTKQAICKPTALAGKTKVLFTANRRGF